MPDREGSRAPVVGLLTVGRVLDLPVGLLDVLDRPLLEAMSVPVADIARSRAHGHGGVDAGAAAEGLAARRRDLRGGGSAASGEPPIVLRVAGHVPGVPQVL